MNSLSKLLLGATVILLLIGIPISTVYWWPQFWGPQFSLASGYWATWIHWLKIASIILAALWLIYLIIWIIQLIEQNRYLKNNTKTNISVSGNTPIFDSEMIPANYGRMSSFTTYIGGKLFYGPGHIPSTTRPAYSTRDDSQGEANATSNIFGPQPVFYEGRDLTPKMKFQSDKAVNTDAHSTKQGKFNNYENDARKFVLNQEVNRDLEEGRITVNEAIKLRQNIDSVNSAQTYRDTRNFLHSVKHKPSK